MKKLKVTLQDATTVDYDGGDVVTDDGKFIDIVTENESFVRLNWRFVVGYVEGN